MFKPILMSTTLLLSTLPTAQAGNPESTTSPCPAATVLHVSAISDAYNLPEGCTVKIQGKVIVAPGTLASGIGNEGFSINDNTRGMFICTQSRLDVKFGDNVSVTGRRGQIIGMPCIAANSVEPLGRAPLLPTGHVPASAIGSVVSVRGTVKEVRDESDFGTKVFIDDGSGRLPVFINKSINLARLPTFTEGVLAEIKGFVAHYPAYTQDKPEIDPRSLADITVINP